MSDKPSASIIVTTYNWSEALRLTLRSILQQSVSPAQIVVADDGSGPDTARVIKEVLGPSILSWSHVWHEHKGVRQSRIKNLAVRHSDHPYLIFVDQDVVLHPVFVADHLAMAEEGLFLQGKRCLLPESYTLQVLTEGGFIPPLPWSRVLGNRKNTLRIPALGRLLARPKSFETSLRGCNLSMFKRDFLKVDGFDEAFDQSWGREDSDICYRLFHAGLRIKPLWFLALQYHLYHGTTTNWDRDRLDLELRSTLLENRIRGKRGLSQLSSEGEIIASSKRP